MSQTSAQRCTKHEITLRFAFEDRLDYAAASQVVSSMRKLRHWTQFDRVYGFEIDVYEAYDFEFDDPTPEDNVNGDVQIVLFTFGSTSEMPFSDDALGDKWMCTVQDMVQNLRDLVKLHLPNLQYIRSTSHKQFTSSLTENLQF